MIGSNPERPAPGNTAILNLERLLKETNLQPLPEYRGQILTELVELVSTQGQPQIKAEIRKQLVERLQLPNGGAGMVENILRACFYSKCLLDQQGQPLIANSTPIASLSYSDPAQLERKCLESWLVRIKTVDEDYFDSPQNIQEFERVVGPLLPFKPEIESRVVVETIPAPTQLNEKLAIVRRDGANWNIYLLDLDGTNCNPLIKRPGNFMSPAWSPNGEWLAYVEIKEQQSQIWKIRSDGSEDTLLTTQPTSVSYDYPVWSSNGQYLLFISNFDGTSSNKSRYIWAMRPDGQNMRKIGSGYFVSENNRALIYSRLSQGKFNLVYSQSDGGPKLINEEGEDNYFFGTFSPDGRRVAVNRSNPNSRTVWVFDLEEIQGRQISQEGQLATTPTWSPDGLYLAYPAQVGKTWEVQIANLLTGQAKTIYKDNAQVIYLSWGRLGT